MLYIYKIRRSLKFLYALQPKKNLQLCCFTNRFSFSFESTFNHTEDVFIIIKRLQKDLFLQPGLHEENQNIRNFLDSQDIGDAPIPGSHHSVAETLLLFLSSLPQSLIPLRHFDDCIGCLEGSAEEFEENLLDVGCRFVSFYFLNRALLKKSL